MKILLGLAAVVVGVVGLRRSRRAQHDPWHEATVPSNTVPSNTVPPVAPHPGT